MAEPRQQFSNTQAAYTQGSRNIADRTVGEWLYSIGVTPNQVTVAGASISLIGCAVWVTQTRFSPTFWVGIGVVLLGTLADLFDGSVARVSGKQSVFGSELDTFTDRVVEAGMYFALAWVLAAQDNETAAVVCLPTLTGCIMVSYARTRAEKLGLKGNVGFGARAERMILLAVGVLAGRWVGYQWIVYAMNVVVWPTFGYRVWSIKQQLIEKGTP